MISHQFTAVMAACLALTACGGGGSDAPSTSTPQTACQPITVAALGDSTAWGLDSFKYAALPPGSPIDLAKANPSPVQVLQTEMDAEFGPGAVIVSEAGVMGASAGDLVIGNAGYRPWPDGITADIVTMNYGINDRGNNHSLAFYESNLRTIVAKTPAGTRLLLETPNFTPGGDTVLGDFAQRMRDVATSTGTPLADTFAYTQALPDWLTRFAPGDFAHPSTEGYRLIAVNSRAPAVAALVRALGCR